MTEIEKTEGEIKVLQAKLELLKEMENPTPVEEAYKRFFGRYPNNGDCWTGDNEEFWYFFQVGYKSAKEDCKVEEGEMIKRNLKTSLQELSNGDVRPMDDVIDRLVEKYKSQKLWNMLRNELGYSVDCTEEIVDLVEKWIPEPQNASGSQNVNTELLVDGFNDCVRKMKEMLR